MRCSPVAPCWNKSERRELEFGLINTVYRSITILIHHHHSPEIRSATCPLSYIAVSACQSRFPVNIFPRLFITPPDSLNPQPHSSTMSNTAGAHSFYGSPDISSSCCRRSTSPVLLHAPSKEPEFTTRCSFTYVFTSLSHTFALSLVLLLENIVAVTGAIWSLF
jgi:hypothetical protein